MFSFFKKKVVIPSNKKDLHTAVELWSVRWTNLEGWTEQRADMVHAYSKAEFFTSEQDAHEFAQSLTEAYALLRHTGPHTRITIKKEQ